MFLNYTVCIKPTLFFFPYSSLSLLHSVLYTQVLKFISFIPNEKFSLVSFPNPLLKPILLYRVLKTYPIVFKQSFVTSRSNKVLMLQVTSVEDVPPPLVEVGPTNQTLPLQSVASLPCQARGSPPPRVRWYHNGSPISPRSSPRLTILPSGTLQIDGKYRSLSKFCKIKQEC